MKEKLKIGIDIGGTHTDAVLISSDGSILAWDKVVTTQPIEDGFKQALCNIKRKHNDPFDQVGEVLIGTTHALNAIIQVQELDPVGLIRLAGHQPMHLPACFQWPEELRRTILRSSVQLDGGFECDGRPITKLNLKAVIGSVETHLKAGAASIVVNGVFSPLYPGQELEVADAIHENFGRGISITLAHQIGGMGLVERENAAILNAALKTIMGRGFRELQDICESLGLRCPIYLTQNNGSRISLQAAMEFPVLTISAGATNSFIGAAKIAGIEDAIIVDIGGTSTDVGMIQKGFPRRQIGNTNLGGVALNFPMPDVASIALGGGTLLQYHDGSDELLLTPQSCGRCLEKDAYAFGGGKLTLTDAGLVFGSIEIPHSRLSSIPCSPIQAENVLRKAYNKVLGLVKKVQGTNSNLPIVLVGGGASLLPRSWLDGRCIVPPHAPIANAYGAALAEITATIDTAVSLDKREMMINDIKTQAVRKLADLGGEPKSARFVDVQIIPYHYMPGMRARVIVTAASHPKT